MHHDIDFVKRCKMAVLTEEKRLTIPPEVLNHARFNEWRAFHMQNRQVIRRIIHEIDRAKSAGLKAVSVKAIINAIRWDYTIETRGKDFKINDAYTGIYTHVIMHNFPQYKFILTYRTLRAKVKE